MLDLQRVDSVEPLSDGAFVSRHAISLGWLESVSKTWESFDRMFERAPEAQGSLAMDACDGRGTWIVRTPQHVLIVMRTE